MRTIIDLTDAQVSALDRLRAETQSSRAELIREAVDAYLVAQQAPSLAELPGFGAWRHKRRDGVAYQRALREEWTR
ncbi:MAG: ribbon-helix-helix domain-containing protein [Thermoflexales bacterium]|nr:ribbon-helix-helix domain-containing protein [Thermoflexales bacterium]